ncbi:MAG: OmpA family protein [Candidatus Kapabacteria bacterium]|nr:OmpA family protein [Candidatus Kapabacteria bacterium]
MKKYIFLFLFLTLSSKLFSQEDMNTRMMFQRDSSTIPNTSTPNLSTYRYQDHENKDASQIFLFKNEADVNLDVPMKEYLNAIVKYLNEHPKAKVEILGHSDNSGADEEKIKRSEARASNAMLYLIEKGISKDKITSKGWGSKKPKADNGTEEGRSKNRRIEILVRL